MKIGELPESITKAMWEYWINRDPSFNLASTLAIMASTGANPVDAAALTLQVSAAFISRQNEAAEEVSKLPFSKLTVRDFGIPPSLGFGSSKGSSGSQTAIIFQDKGVEALGSPLKDDQFPPPAAAGDTITEILLPINEWNAVVLDGGKKSEAKLNCLIENRQKKLLRLPILYSSSPLEFYVIPKLQTLFWLTRNCESQHLIQ